MSRSTLHEEDEIAKNMLDALLADDDIKRRYNDDQFILRNWIQQYIDNNNITQFDDETKSEIITYVKSHYRGGKRKRTRTNKKRRSNKRRKFTHRRRH